MSRYWKIPIAILALIGLPIVPIGDALGWSGGAIGTACIGVLVVALLVQMRLLELERPERPRSQT